MTSFQDERHYLNTADAGSVMSAVIKKKPVYFTVCGESQKCVNQTDQHKFRNNSVTLVAIF